MNAFVGRFVGAFVGVLEGLKAGKSTRVGPVVGALVGALVGPLVGPLERGPARGLRLAFACSVRRPRKHGRLGLQGCVFFTYSLGRFGLSFFYLRWENCRQKKKPNFRRGGKRRQKDQTNFPL